MAWDGEAKPLFQPSNAAGYTRAIPLLLNMLQSGGRLTPFLHLSEQSPFLLHNQQQMRAPDAWGWGSRQGPEASRRMAGRAATARGQPRWHATALTER
eukprot:1159720-Pelagomonas_calceolata.AAC.3